MIAYNQTVSSDSECFIFPKPRLTPTETNVYNYFLRRPGVIVTHDELKQYLYVGTRSAVWEYVRRIIGKNGAPIRNIRGVGYILETKEAENL